MALCGPLHRPHNLPTLPVSRQPLPTLLFVTSTGGRDLSTWHSSRVGASRVWWYRAGYCWGNNVARDAWKPGDGATGRHQLHRNGLREHLLHKHCFRQRRFRECQVATRPTSTPGTCGGERGWPPVAMVGVLLFAARLELVEGQGCIQSERVCARDPLPSVPDETFAYVCSARDYLRIGN